MFQKRCLISREKDNLTLSVKNLEFISTLRGLPHDREAYIVGGTVRDLLIGKEPVDVDIAVCGDAEGFARFLFKKIGGALFLLDKRRRIFRITTREKTPPYYFDVSPMRGEDIVADLSLRDFTIDALAIPFSDVNAVIDPFHGREDLKKRCIRVISRRSFEDDPLRLLRAFRLASTLNFEIEGNTFNMIQGMSSLLRRSAVERIRDEFFNLLSASDSAKYLYQMHEAGLFHEILPGLVKSDIEAGIRVLAELEGLYNSLKDLFYPLHRDLEKYLQVKIEEGINKAALWKWISLYIAARVSEGFMIEAVKGLRLGNKALRVATLAVRHFKTPILNSGKDKKSLYHFFKSTGSDGIGLILFHIASSSVTIKNKDRAALNAMDALSWYLHEYREMIKSPLITGDDLIELFHIPPGPVFKKLLDLVEENRAANILATREDAISLLKKMLM